ncbi:MAG: class I SAM-dependent methyltransferase [Thermoanaerobaculia bacterium]|nr:class I SAM-dependent methyltransferase [Thermoanaerobaculia bacterium]
MTILDVDFGRMYRDHLAASGRREKPPEAWDARAAEMGPETQGSYVTEFVRRMDLSGCETLLDVGCGPGTIALAVADRLSRVYGLDYSRGMLNVLMENAAARGLSNVEPIQCAWEDDWSDVPACDVVVASRSTLVSDMAEALAKLDARAHRRVYLTSLVGGRFVHGEIFQALGRTQPPFPDYIYILNILYRMGRLPRLDYIDAGGRTAGGSDFESLVRQVTFSLGELSPAEMERLAAWYHADPERAQQAGAPRCWAFVSWETLGR